MAYIYPCKFGDDCDFVSLGGGDEQRETLKIKRRGASAPSPEKYLSICYFVPDFFN